LLFVEIRFLFFFALVFAAYWSLRSNTVRKALLLAASCIFYGAWDWRFLALILFSTTVDYAVALALESTDRPARRRALIVVSLVANLGVLGFFKYFNFFVDSAADMLAFLGLQVHPRTLDIVLPVGISFYTFQTLSYTIEVYRRELAAEKSFLDISFFVIFFPQLVAGPIVRASDFLPQVHRPKLFDDVDVKGCLVLFLVGFVKKACIADNLAPIVDDYFSAPETFAAQAAWLSVLFYAVQIYCDFSGYSDMAIACAGLLGYRLMLNFSFPYFSHSIAEFWKRWHISLSTWLRDYLYIPLGGNRGSRAKTYRNLILTMLLGGLWHGAAWTFVAWGALHGVALIFHRAFSARVPPLRLVPPRVAALLGTAATFYAVCVAWIVFRAPDMPRALTALRSFALFESPGSVRLPATGFLLFAALAGAHYVAHRHPVTAVWRRMPGWAFSGAYGAAAALALAFVPVQYKPFIYFQF